MAELADAADSKSAAGHPAWGFNSPLQHQLSVPLVRLISLFHEDSLLRVLCGLKSLNTEVTEMLRALCVEFLETQRTRRSSFWLLRS